MSQISIEKFSMSPIFCSLSTSFMEIMNYSNTEFLSFLTGKRKGVFVKLGDFVRKKPQYDSNNYAALALGTGSPFHGNHITLFSNFSFVKKGS